MEEIDRNAVGIDSINSFLNDLIKCIYHYLEESKIEFNENNLFMLGDRRNTMVSVDLERKLVDFIKKFRLIRQRLSGNLDISANELENTLQELKLCILKDIQSDFGDPPLQEGKIPIFLNRLFMYSINVCFWVKACATQPGCSDSNVIERNLSILTDTYKILSQKKYLNKHVFDTIPNQK